MIKLRIGDIDTFSVENFHSAVTDRSGYSETHGNTMIKMRIDHCTVEWTSPWMIMPSSVPSISAPMRLGCQP